MNSIKAHQISNLRFTVKSCNIARSKAAVRLLTMAATMTDDLRQPEIHRLNDFESTAGQWHEPPNDIDVPALPRVDGGKSAWLFLAACFVLEALVWGLSPAFFSSLLQLTPSQGFHSLMASSKSTIATQNHLLPKRLELPPSEPRRQA